MKSNNNTPAIRFAGYTAPWERRQLLDNIQKITDFRGKTPRKLGLNWSNDGYLALSAANVKNGYIDFSQDAHYGNQELYDKWMTGNELHQGQVLFTTEAPMGNVAQIPDDRRYILSQRTIAFSVNPNLLTENFLAVILRTQHVTSALTAMLSGGTAKGVSQKSLAAVDVTLPQKISEQNSLASLFSDLDRLITLHQRKYEKLVNLKKAMLDKMFPKNGKLVPEVRFAGFSGNWERRKLGEMAQFNPKEVVPNEFEYVDLESVVGTEMLSHRRVTKRSAPSRAQRVAHVGDLFYQTVRPYQKNNYLFEMADGDYVFSTGYAQMRPSVDGYFLLSVILHDKFVNAVLNMCIGTGYPAVNSKDLAKIEVCAPTQLAEQQIIGRYFRMLDKLTNLQQRKLAKLQKLKSAFLEKMFV